MSLRKRRKSHPSTLVVLMTVVVKTLLVISNAKTTQSQDNDPPVVTCDNVTLMPELPNLFIGLQFNQAVNGYTYSDPNGSPNLVRYNVTIYNFLNLAEATLFPPGYTTVALIALDNFGNEATCIFYVQNTLTELPVNCPDRNETVNTDQGEPTYTFTSSFGPGDVTKSLDPYEYHGDTVNVDVSIDGATDGTNLGVGTHEATIVISDDVLNKTCVSYINVQDTENPNISCPSAILENSRNVIDFTVNVTDNVNATPQYSKMPGSIFLPGTTTVNVTATDDAGNMARCSFSVDVRISELPVNCPDLSGNVITDHGQSTYTFRPSFGPGDVTKSLVDYVYYGGGVSLNFTIDDRPEGSAVGHGMYQILILISDDELSKTCSSVIHVQAPALFPTLAVALGSFFVVLFLILVLLMGTFLRRRIIRERMIEQNIELRQYNPIHEQKRRASNGQ